MGAVYLNRIETAVPDYDIHHKFVTYAPRLLPDSKSRQLFQRMADRAQIDHRYSFLQPHSNDDQLDAAGFYTPGNFPDTESRMKFYEQHALTLACKALDKVDLSGTTHLLVTTCTGFYAPGLDLQIVKNYGLAASIERTIIGFMGCYAAFNALKLARHIVRSDRSARVAILNIELCTLHLKQNPKLEEMLSFLIFADGCAASIVSSQPDGLELQSLRTSLLPDSADQITWAIGGHGFDMNLSGRVPATIARALPQQLRNILEGRHKEDIRYWAIHPGGRSILDAVQEGANLEKRQLDLSRDVLRRFGNMSSATIMFVLAEIMKQSHPAAEGCAMAFGPGLTIESMRFATAGA